MTTIAVVSQQSNKAPLCGEFSEWPRPDQEAHRRQQLVPIFYQGQPTDGDPDHFVTRADFRRGLRSHPAKYVSINRGTAGLDISTCLTRFPEHKNSIKLGWRGVTANVHSFDFRRNWPGWQMRLGPKTRQLTRFAVSARHAKIKIEAPIRYSQTQNRDNNQEQVG